jgi:divalent metal cation (Fe/Co/Zn/Cd) transporter
MRAFDRDLIHGEHYGQRPGSAARTGRTHGCTNQPRTTAKENPCQRGAVRDREQRALRLISFAFFGLVAYVLAQSAYTLSIGRRPAPSISGLVWLVATVLAMLLLAWGKHVMGRGLKNKVLMTEARVTLVDAYLAAAVLVGIGLSAALGWWWADPLSGLVTAYYGFREANEARRHATEP